MILISLSQALEGLPIVPDQNRIHAFSDGYLPGVVLPHAVPGSALPGGRPLGLSVADPLPAKSQQPLPHGLGTRCSLQDLLISNGTDPKLGPWIALQPIRRRSWTPISVFVVEVDQERRVQQTAFHRRLRMRRLSSPQCFFISASKSAAVR